MEKIRVILISSVRPAPTSAGQIILHRHLVDRPGIELEVYGGEPKRFSPSMVLRRVLGKVAKWGPLFEVAVNCLWVLWEGRWMDCDLPRNLTPGGKTVVMTVAHGDGFYAAQRFAKKHSLPLVVFFQDWWPDMAGVPKPFVKLLDEHFLALAKSCSLGICVCEGMKSALGGGENFQVLPPIPAETSEPLKMVSPQKNDFKFKILYSGNLDLYGGMLLEALRVFKGHPTIQLQVRGSNPNWPENAKKEMRDAGLWLDFAPRAELEEWLESADAFLIPMVFEEKYRRRMETSFPSKLIEFAQFGKPLIVWGPEYCSAVEWAWNSQDAIPVVNSSPKSLVNSIQKRLLSKRKSHEFSVQDFCPYEKEFNPLKIQVDFFDFLKQLEIKNQIIP